MGGKKRQSAIEDETNNYEEESAPSYGNTISNEERKLRLQKTFELGADCPAVYKGVKVKPQSKPKPKKIAPHKQQIAELVQGMEERQNFLEEMRAAGMADKYEAQIKGEVAQCMREIEKLEAAASGKEPHLDDDDDDDL